jgi:hypothetical protein
MPNPSPTPSGLFPTGSATKPLYVFFISPCVLHIPPIGEVHLLIQKDKNFLLITYL